MADQLFVDTESLHAAGTALNELTFPAAPAPPASIGGTDAVSAATRATVPVLETPVLEALPALQALLSTTARNMVTAAQIYTEADGLLGEHIGTADPGPVQGVAAAATRTLSAGIPLITQAAAAAGDTEDAAGQLDSDVAAVSSSAADEHAPVSQAESGSHPAAGSAY